MRYKPKDAFENEDKSGFADFGGEESATQRKPLVAGGMFGTTDIKGGVTAPEDRNRKMNALFDEEDDESPVKPRPGGIKEPRK